MTFSRSAQRRRPHTEFLIRILVLLCGTVGTALLAFVTQLALTRSMNVQEYGRLVAILAAVNVATPVAGCGLGWFWLQLFGQEGWAALRWIVPTIRISGAASLVSASLLVAYVALSGREPVAQTALVAGLLIPILLGQSLAETTSARLQLEERYRVLAVWQLLTQLGRSLVVVTAVVVGFCDLIVLLTGYALVGAAIAAISAKSLNDVRRGCIRLVGHGTLSASTVSKDLPPLPQVFAEAAPYCLITLFYLIYSQGIVTIVERFIGPEAAAMYNVSYLIVAAIYLIPNVIYTKYLVAKIFRWWTQDREMFSAVLHVGIAAHFVLGILCMVAVMASASFVIPLMFGTRYAAAAPILILLSIGIPIRFVQHSYGSALFSKENIPRKVRYMGLAAAASIALNASLIPLMGLAGAAISGVLAELLLLILYVNGAARHAGVDVRATFRIAAFRSSLAYIGKREVQSER